MVCEACGVGEVGEQWRGNKRTQVGGDEDPVMNEVVAPSAKASHDVLTNSLLMRQLPRQVLHVVDHG